MSAFLKLRSPALISCLLAFVLCGGQVSAQTPKLFQNGLPDTARPRTADLVKADLLADTSAVVAGKPFTVGLRLQMAPEWHTYWQYSGDAGLPTKIAWQLPEGFKAGPIQWPVPDKIVSPGDIINYGYSGETMLLVEITPPANLPPGDVTLKAKADWLVCRESCVPGNKELELTLPGGGTSQAANSEIFSKYRGLLPQAYNEQAAGFRVDRQADGAKLVLRVEATGKFDFFPLPVDPAEVSHPQVVADGGKQTITVPVDSGAADVGKVGGLLVREDGGKREGWILSPGVTGTAPPIVDAGGRVNGPVRPAVAANQVAAKGPGGPVGSLGYFLLVGFLGGLILNVMPCVLPVISLKLFSFVKQANQSRERVFRLGLAYAAGVFAWFLGFAALVVALKAAGHQVGYAFHLQNPWFLVGLSAVTFVFALNLLGVFEVILPGSVTGAAGEVAGSREGYTGAFLQGMLATVLGSACTAPFFGPALGFAFSQNGPVVFAMFAAIAAGMSTPFVLLAWQPGWMKFLPKPGVWMERVKQATGFLLLGTMLWLLFSLGDGKGADAVVWTGVLLLVLGAACWVQGAFNTLVASDGVRWASRAAIAVLVLGGGWMCVDRIAHSERPTSSNQSFAAQLDAAQKTGRTVFVDFTAEWCVSCKSNEKVVLNTEPIQKALRERNIVFLKADYTFYSEDIAKLLKQFNAVTVPLYVIYPAGRPDAPMVLPLFLTKQTVLDALAAAAPQGATSKPVAAR